MQQQMTHIKDVIAMSIDQIEARVMQTEAAVGLSTGFKFLDRYLYGFHKGELVVLAARPCMGVSLLARTLVLSVAQSSECCVSVFATRCSQTTYATRLIAQLSELSDYQVANGQMKNEDDWATLKEGIMALKELPIYINDTTGLTISEINDLLQDRSASDSKQNVVFIDSLESIRPDDSMSKKSKVDQLADNARRLKDLAMQRELTVVVESGLERELESRENKRPLLSDLPAYPYVPRYANTVLLLYRDEVYEPDSKRKDQAELTIAQSDTGHLSTLMLNFDGVTFNEGLYSF